MSDIPYEGVIPISVPIPVPVRDDDLIAEVERLRAELAAAQARILELRDEVEILRLYGNKDCTSMADAVLAEMRKGESDAK